MKIEAEDDLAQAEAEAERSRRRLTATLAELKGRLTPAALVRNAGQKFVHAGNGAARSAVRVVRRHPLPALGVIALLVTMVTRRPIARLLGRDKLKSGPVKRSRK